MPISGETTESTLVFANPDGTFTAEISSGAARVRRSGGWLDVDTGLVPADGVLRAKVAVADVEFSAGGAGTPMVRLRHSGGRSLELTWPTALPKPVVKGNTATYVDAAGPNADLVLTMTPRGFSEDIVLRKKPVDPLRVEIGVEGQGLTLGKGKNGRLEVKGADGDIVAAAPEPFVIDGTRAKNAGRDKKAHPAGLPARAVTPGRIETRLTADGNGRQKLSLAPDAAFLNAPDAVYPMVVDPTFSLWATTDTYVISSSPSSSYGGSSLLYVSNAGYGEEARSFINFSGANVNGATISSATLTLTHDYDSSFKYIDAQISRVTSSWGNSTTWRTQPSYTSEGAVWADGTGTANVNVKSIVQAWAAGAPNYGFALTDCFSCLIYSAESYEGDPPELSITYSYPPVLGTINGGPKAIKDNTTYYYKTTPTLSAVVSDADGGTVSARFEIEHDPAATSQGSGTIWSGAGSTVNAGSPSVVTIPAGKLNDGWKIRWRAAGTDGSTTTAWSAWQYATISTAAANYALPFASVFSPINNTQVGTLTPVLAAHADPWAGGIASYWFQVCSGTPGTSWAWCESSPSWTTSDNWTVPAGKLAWGKTYWWYAMATFQDATVTSSWRSFTVVPEQATINSFLASGVEDREFNPEVGNYTHTETDLEVAAVGLPLSVRRTYNSLDPRTDGAFGLGWSTRWDTKLTSEPATKTLLITHPDGRQLRFAAKGDGTYASPSGVYATLSALPGGGWRLMDKSATSYWFDAGGRLTKVSDHRGRTQDLVYGTNGRLARATATGGRSLFFTWTGNHVTAVSTDPVNGAPMTWTYAYDGDKLTKACPPGTSSACTAYSYGTPSRYQSQAIDGGPVGYWRLNDSSGAIGSKIVSSVGWDGGASDAKIAGGSADATLRMLGALDGSGNTAMRFKGTANSAYVSLPPATISGKGGDLAVEAWFKTAASGTVVGYQNSAGSPTSYTPAIYVGTDGKLRGQFWTGTANPITSTKAVNDNTWHHVVLEGATNTQTLYLDGAVVGTRTGTITHAGQWDARIGYGYAGGSWPATVSSPGPFPFAGDIDEVAVYRNALGLPRIAEHVAAKITQPQIVKVVSPEGRVVAENTYATDGGRLLTHTDDDGGTWKLSAQEINAISDTQSTSKTTVTDPLGGTITYVGDALRDYRVMSRTDQLGKTATVEYDTGGFPAKTLDPNGNVEETLHNARGNMIGRNRCRMGTTCYWEWFGYEEPADPFDPRNDQMRSFHDARSSSYLDDTYAWRWSFNAFGEVTGKTVPGGHGTPTVIGEDWDYTDGTEAAVGGGTTPPGLVKRYRDAKKNQTTYAYTAAGDLAKVTGPTGLVTTYTYDSLGRVTGETRVSSAFPDGVTTTTAYDAQGRVASVTSPGVKNEITGVTHTARKTLTYDWDDNVLTTTVADLTGGDAARVTTSTFDGFGRLATSTEPEGGVETYGYDVMGRKVSVTDAVGARYAYAYTARGEHATTTLKGWTGSPVAPQPATDVVLESYAYDPAGRLASETDAMGRTTAYTYFNDDLTAQVTAKGAKLNGSTTGRDVVLESSTYDPSGRLTAQVLDGGLLRVEVTYDARGRRIGQVSDPAGLARTETLTYDDNDLVVKVAQGAAGSDRVEVTDYAYDAANQPIRVTTRNDDQDLVSTMRVDDRGLVTAITDPRGNQEGATAADYTTTIRYDEFGNPVEMTQPKVAVERAGAGPQAAQPVSRIGYNTFGEQTHLVDPEGRRSSSAFDRAGRQVSHTSPSYTPPGGQPITPTVTATYDKAGQQISSTDARGNTTTARYDALGRKVQVVDPAAGGAAAGAWTYTYDLNDEALSLTDPTGARMEATYDDLGRQITFTTLERRPTTAAYVTKLEYDDADNLLKAIRPTGDSTTRAYNALDELTSYTDAAGDRTTFAYDLAGRPTRTTNPLGVATTAAYDLAGRQTATADVDASGAVLRTRRFGYDAAGNPTSRTTASGHTSTRTYDALGRLVEQREPVSASETITTSFGYDASGLQTRATDGRGNATYTTYNPLGLPESVIEPSTPAHPSPADRTFTAVYDAGGNQVGGLLPGGVKIQRTFDELNRLVKQAGSGAEVATEDKNYTYDLAGRLLGADELSFSLNDRGLLLKSSTSGNDVSAYAYDGSNRLVQRTDVNGVASFTWDAADRLSQMTDPVSNTTIGYGYDQASRLTSMSYGAGGARRTYGYDPLNRLVKDELKTDQGAPIASIAYDYDIDDNVTSKTTAGTAGAGTNRYTYDWADRLTSWTGTDGKTTTYGWDAAGNRIRVDDKVYTYDQRNRLTSGDGATFTYTARGTLAETSDGRVRITKSDAFDRLIQDDTVTYDYDALDRVSTRSENGTTTRFAYDGVGDDIIAVTDGDNRKKAAYGRDPYGRTVSLADTGSAQLAFSDLHGDLVGAFSANGAALLDSIAYNPFGEVIAQSGATHDLGYQGGYTDPTTKKVNMAARWYQPSTGSFVSRDTMSLPADPSVQLNRYIYANANPLANVDPDGHAAKKTTKKTVKTAKKTKTTKTKKQEYDACKKQGFKNKNGLNCNAEKKLNNESKKFNADCRDGFNAKGETKACAQGATSYVACRLGGSGQRNCEGKGVKEACLSLAGAGLCGGSVDAYNACRANSKIARSVCIESSSQYRDCMHRYTNAHGTCVGASVAYGRCRSDGRNSGDVKQCTVVREVYSVCAYQGSLSGLGGRNGFNFDAAVCNEVANDTIRCFTKVKGSLGDCFSAGVVQMDCIKEANNLAECGKLADAIYWCMLNPRSDYCGAKPADPNCKKSERRRTCTTYYSAVQSWFASGIYKKSDLTTPGICQATSFLSYVPGAKPVETVASTICGLIDNGVKILNGLDSGNSFNESWKKARLAHPGSGINYVEDCVLISGDVGTACVISVRRA
ncbi:DNRLRE domain-containing protein [Sphaerisporangium sp. NPDC004334]